MVGFSQSGHFDDRLGFIDRKFYYRAILVMSKLQQDKIKNFQGGIHHEYRNNCTI